ncbi:hypothetical protein OTERR_13080 [Oryzomicrobium terrae]|uniref:Uncharacterized protein n=1 Tax=Oryzomicrobium terrae TaxID=1735038 RepID=A0A5C1E841_9RHOO|nr:ParB N-terminal domain-containing protein [Oryzomicrobium terrae]QEL64784.1 hypothetical protein OTERR_13080 [Oryzomicrobium terrae]
MTKPPVVKRIASKELSFDPQNPRFYRLSQNPSDEDVIEEMLDDEGVQDLIASIGQKGYFEGEPLLVTREHGILIVVEGNRRLAAVKLLNRELEPPPRRKTSVEQLRDEAEVVPPTVLPCIEYPTRRDVMRYLGYRHITGIKEWDSLSKAKYLASIRQEFYADLDHSTQLKSLAKDIGSRSDYVGQLLTALGLYIAADNQNFFHLPMTAKDVEFSYLTTALNYRKITDWLGLEGRTDIDMPDLKIDNLKRVFSWMFPRDQQGRTIVGESRNIDKLSEIVSSDAAIEILEKTSRLSEAYLYSEGPQQALITAFTQAQERISKRYGTCSPQPIH